MLSNDFSCNNWQNVTNRYRRVRHLVLDCKNRVIPHTEAACVLSIENPQNRKENSPLSDREIPIIRKKHVESFRFFPYLVGKKAAFTAFCPIG